MHPGDAWLVTFNTMSL